jgi:hypothetical protein
MATFKKRLLGYRAKRGVLYLAVPAGGDGEQTGLRDRLRWLGLYLMMHNNGY